MTTGSIGKLEFNNRQVGGFMNWDIVCNHSIFIPEPKTIATADKFWMTERNDNILLASFYFDINNKLVLAQQAEVQVLLPQDYSLNKVINYPLKMVFV